MRELFIFVPLFLAAAIPAITQWPDDDETGIHFNAKEERLYDVRTIKSYNMNKIDRYAVVNLIQST